MGEIWGWKEELLCILPQILACSTGPEVAPHGLHLKISIVEDSLWWIKNDANILCLCSKPQLESDPEKPEPTQDMLHPPRTVNIWCSMFVPHQWGTKQNVCESHSTNTSELQFIFSQESESTFCKATFKIVFNFGWAPVFELHPTSKPALCFQQHLNITTKLGFFSLSGLNKTILKLQWSSVHDVFFLLCPLIYLSPDLLQLNTRQNISIQQGFEWVICRAKTFTVFFSLVLSVSWPPWRHCDHSPQENKEHNKIIFCNAHPPITWFHTRFFFFCKSSQQWCLQPRGHMMKCQGVHTLASHMRVRSMTSVGIWTCSLEFNSRESSVGRCWIPCGIQWSWAAASPCIPHKHFIICWWKWNNEVCESKTTVTFIVLV